MPKLPMPNNLDENTHSSGQKRNNENCNFKLDELKGYLARNWPEKLKNDEIMEEEYMNECDFAPEITPSTSSDCLATIPRLSRSYFKEYKPNLPVITYGKKSGRNLKEFDKFRRSCDKYILKKKSFSMSEENRWSLSYFLSFFPFFREESAHISTYKEPYSVYLESEDSLEDMKQFQTQKGIKVIQETDDDVSITWEELAKLSTNLDSDTDRLFLLSVLPLMKQLEPKDNLDFRLEIQKFLKSKLYPVSQVDLSSKDCKSSCQKLVSRRTSKEFSRTSSSRHHHLCPKSDLKPNSQRKERFHSTDTAI